jgi:hypothetical protein
LMELKVALRVQTQRKCKHQCHWTCSLEIGTYIFNDAGRQTAYKKTTKIHFFGRILPNDVWYSCFEGIY